MMNTNSAQAPRLLARNLLYGVLAIATLIVLGALVWQGMTASGNPDPTTPNLSHGAVLLNTGLLVFREGLEAILVLSALTASMTGRSGIYRRPVVNGAILALAASVATWFVVIAIINQINAPEYAIQAGTGILAIVVLLVIMNWFFHKVYWTGWISLHNNHRRNLLARGKTDRTRTLQGLALLGFSAMYREGFEVVLFLQDLRLKAGSAVVLEGVAIGLAFTAIVGILTFVVHQHLPYKKMLILTGILLAGVLVVMVGESVQEMQLAHWIASTDLQKQLPIPDWMGLWFAVFPNLQSLIAQACAVLLVGGSYFGAQYIKIWRPRHKARLSAGAHAR